MLVHFIIFQIHFLFAYQFPYTNSFGVSLLPSFPNIPLLQVDSDGSEIGFGSLVQAIFEFIQALTERKKYKAMIRKVLPDVLFYLITYLSIPEYQVCLLITGLQCCTNKTFCDDFMDLAASLLYLEISMPE